MAVGPPVSPEESEQLRRKRNVAIFPSLPPLDVDQHAIAIDLRNLLMDAFVDAQASRIDRGEADVIVRQADRTKCLSE